MTSTARRRLSEVGPQGLLGRIGWSGAIEITQLVGSLLVFAVLADTLVPEDYGIMGAILGIAAPTASIGGLGTHYLLIKRVSQGEDLAWSWKRATSMSVMGLGAASLLVIALQPLLLGGVSRWVYALFILSQVNFFWFTELAVYVGNGTRRLKEAAQIRFMVVSCRIVAVVWFFFFGEGVLLRWAVASALSFGVAVVLALAYVWIVFKAAPSAIHGSMEDVREGVPFSANGISESLVDASDRPLLVNYGHEIDAGVYTLGARITQFGYLPLRMLLRASDADLFQAGKRGVLPALDVIRSLVPMMAGVGFAVGFGMFIMAPLLPLVFGDQWQDAVGTIRLLSALPFIRGIQYLLGNAISATGLQWWRVGGTLSAAALNFSLNAMLLPTGNWRTAVFTTMVSELFLTAVLALVLYRQALIETRNPPAP
ncbi:MAG: lipopolysaccharide biosynthesis protein [Actinomycetota bacterium]